MRETSQLTTITEASTRVLLDLVAWPGTIVRSSELPGRSERSARLADLTCAVGATTYLCGTSSSSGNHMDRISPTIAACRRNPVGQWREQAAPDPVPTQLSAPPLPRRACADVPEAGHLRPGLRGSHGGRFGPPRHRYPLRWASPAVLPPVAGTDRFCSTTLSTAGYVSAWLGQPCAGAVRWPERCARQRGTSCQPSGSGKRAAGRRSANQDCRRSRHPRRRKRAGDAGCL